MYRWAVAAAVLVNTVAMGALASTIKSPEQRTLLFPSWHPQTRHFHAVGNWQNYTAFHAIMCAV